MSTERTHRNHLAGETSPYLLQHADNPVDWYPWGEEALARARAENRPILLSIGYAACHWCHVMAHESFEDEATASVMNRLFTNIKVDREERPDLDRIYQTALQILTHRNGGWPLTMFLDPDGLAPFYGGTYFPGVPRYGLPAFTDVLERVASFFHEHRTELREQGEALREQMASLGRGARAASTPSAVALDTARHQLEHAFDPRLGGFGSAPKFPHPPNLVRLLRHWSSARRCGSDDPKAVHMATFTLARMASGGIHDHLGGGFYRYSVDAQWMIPHFEKMLYDNAQLLPLYADAWTITGDERYARVAADTAEWMMREMQSPEGGYYSSLDADSEGEEGRYYVWSREEVLALLDQDEYAVFAPRYGLDHAPNFEHAWHLHCQADLDVIAQTQNRSLEEVERLIEAARVRMLRVRERRQRPATDDKILTSWNALAIRGMASAARALGRDDLLDSALRAANFVRAHLWQDGRLRVSWREGRATLDAELELLQTFWRNSDLTFAVELADSLLARFEDKAGGFFFTAHDHERLFHRPKTWGDDALPSGNAIAARALLRLGHLLGEKRYLDAAERAIHAAWPEISELAYAHNAMLDALEEYLNPPQLVILRGESDTVREWQEICRESYRPDRLVFALPGDAEARGIIAAYEAPRSGARAWVCSGTHCSAPVTNAEALREALA
jgi:uncharacterized protein YyaL (SSP411 family)